MGEGSNPVRKIYRGDQLEKFEEVDISNVLSDSCVITTTVPDEPAVTPRLFPALPDVQGECDRTMAVIRHAQLCVSS